MDSQFAGQLTARGGYADADRDGSGELRLMPELTAGAAHRVILHYEAVGVVNRPALPPSDARRLFDLTHVWHADEDSIAYHRLDRLSYRHAAAWGTVTLGRGAITWGNGLVFNPMDLFNPFAPTDVERDFKLGDDLALLSLYPQDWNGNMEWQLLAVPRRDPLTGSLRASESSLALKGHLAAGEGEWDFLVARHYDETVIGLGRIGYLGDAVWRWDATVTFASGGHEFFSTVANLDYSWNWNGLNWYGSVEAHFNTFGTPDYAELPRNAPLLERLLRGELHTLGRAYVAPSLQVELHPLLNFFFSGIVNLEDPSAALLPRLVWNVRQDLELTFGGNLYLGGPGTEFGGLPPLALLSSIAPADRLYLWCTAWF